jgi:anti-anti-sigma factor
MITVRERRMPGVVILDVDGDLRVPVPDTLRTAVERLLGLGTRQLLLSLAGVRTLDAAGVGQLAHLRNTAAAFGAVLQIADVPARARTMLVLAGLFELLSAEPEWRWLEAV